MKTLLLLFALAFSIIAHSQDLIVFDAGDTLRCEITGVSSDVVSAKTDKGSMRLNKSNIESYRFRSMWTQVSGPVAAPMATAYAGNSARIQFERSLSSAGEWLNAGVIVSFLAVGAGLLLNDTGFGIPLYIAGGLFLPISIIAAGSKLNAAAYHHSKIPLY